MLNSCLARFSLLSGRGLPSPHCQCPWAKPRPHLTVNALRPSLAVASPSTPLGRGSSSSCPDLAALRLRLAPRCPWAKAHPHLILTSLPTTGPSSPWPHPDFPFPCSRLPACRLRLVLASPSPRCPRASPRPRLAVLGPRLALATLVSQPSAKVST